MAKLKNLTEISRLGVLAAQNLTFLGFFQLAWFELKRKNYEDLKTWPALFLILIKINKF
jgi:hypothetical protein